ncbi:MAG: PLP-dependent aspartate aminotransferase family protein [Proteobacteria bacterium]|nr:PLP-dependent aspartate aminotransferase family protein [Pseudomonadota bacterium]
MAIDPKSFTQVVHAGAEPDQATGAIMPPIYMTSTFVQSEPGVHQGYDYSRADNPTRELYEKALASIESANHALSFASGLAAEQAIIQLLDPGARILVSDDVYGGTGRLFRRLFARYNLDFQFIDLSDDHVVKAAATAPTKLIWLETPSNPTMKVIDIAKLAKVAKAQGALLVVDNTFASPIFQSPLALGADIVVHSTTKYIGGHSDMIGGALMVNDAKLFEQLKFIQFAAGAVPAPLECFLLHRSIKTLAVRMQQHEKNALAVASFLQTHKQVKKVYYPGLSSHPGYDIACRQMRGFSGMVSFDHRGSYADVVAFLQKLRVFTLAESLGGVESLVNHPEKMTHASVPEELRRKLGIGPQMIRLSVGIEAADDLLEDLAQAL